MEQEKNDDIGQLFRSSFEGHTQAPERGEWEMLQSSMQSFNFFRFNALQFNIYYAGMIAFCFLTCLGMGTHYTYSHIINPYHQLESNKSVIMSDSLKNENQTNKGSISNPDDVGTITNPGSGEGNSTPNISKSSNYYKQTENNNDEDDESNALTAGNANSGLKPAILSNPAIKTDSSHKSIEHKPGAPEADSSKIKKRTIYITKQDTIYKYDTLRAPKPKRRRF